MIDPALPAVDPVPGPPAIGTVPVVRPAATVVVFRHAAPGPPELLMLERARAMRFGGAAVFPGGTIDAADHELAAGLGLRAGSDGDLLDGPARIAAIRETLEETGLAIGIDRPVSGAQAAAARALLLTEGALAPVLARMGWGLAPQVLVSFARWCPRFQVSFDTRFYLADLGTGAVAVTADLTENTQLFWGSAAATLAMADRGDISIIYPTRLNLHRLAQFGSFDAARADALAHPVRMITPAIAEAQGKRWLTIPDDVGYPVTRQALDAAMRG